MQAKDQKVLAIGPDAHAVGSAATGLVDAKPSKERGDGKFDIR